MTYRKPRHEAGLSSLYAGRIMSDPATEHPEFFKPAAEEEPLGLGFAGVNGSQTTEDAPAVAASPSNRTTGAVVALLGGLVFAVLYAGIPWFYSSVVSGKFEQPNFVFLATPVYWLTAIAFTLYFVILAILINKGHWRTFVLWGLFVAILTYATAIGAGLLTVRAWTLSFSEANAFVWEGIAFNPFVLVAFVLAREIPIWFGGWIAVKGRKLRDAPEVDQ